MVGSELRLATFKSLLCKINLYEKSILHNGYEKLGTCKNKKRLDGLRNSINGEVSQILNELKTEGIDHPREDFLWGELIVCLENEGEFKSFVVELKKISLEIFQESEILNIASIANFNFTREWMFPTSTADVRSDITIINSFVEGDFSNIDDLFVDRLMDNERVKKTLSGWQKCPEISKRLPLIEEAIEAHIDKKFYLSVSALIPQVEGLLRDALQIRDQNIDFTSIRKEDIRRATCALKDSWKSHYDLPEATLLLESLPDAVSDIYEEYDATKSVPGKLYRHGVCHGLQTDFNSKKNSIRLILLLDRIIFFYVRYRTNPPYA
ncbi:hypothetical protein QUA35_08715 [Microcoleus sp. N9_B2]|uniref:hypothetical protein n=1 Tax=unclassified Microcoleus TaxID=2642155 RepID=UPI002FD4980E